MRSCEEVLEETAEEQPLDQTPQHTQEPGEIRTRPSIQAAETAGSTSLAQSNHR